MGVIMWGLIMDEFEEAFPIPAHWIEWSPSKNRYDCHVGLADSKCSEYNNMFKVWQHQQAKIDEYYETGVALNTETINQRRYILSQSSKINELQNRVDGVSQVLCELKESMDGFKEMDLYDKGCRVAVEYVIADLEKALRGEHD